MRHQPLQEVHQRADIQHSSPAHELLSTADRLERWATVLSRHPDLLNTFEGTEYKRPGERDLMRRDASPLSLAYSDVVLRKAGLADDTYGEAKRFFGLTDHQLHHVICDCHCGSRISGAAAADRVHALVPTGSWLGNMMKAIRRWLQ